jgi:LacI family transcriptional regulator
MLVTAMRHPVTMKDIALRAGVSRATVGFVLNGTPTSVRISDDTRRRVLAAAEEMRYRPNSSARAMRSGRFGMVALLQSTVRHRSLIPMELLDGIHDGLAERDLHLVYTKIPDEKLTSDGFPPKILRESASDGLLINYNTDIPPSLLALIREHRIPAIWLNSKQEADCVYPDDFRAGREATEQLIQAGHTRIQYVDYGGTHHYSGLDRRLGYEEAMRAAGLPIRAIYGFEGKPSAPHAGWTDDMEARLAAPDRPTGFVLYTPHMLAAVLLAAQRRGLRIPEDLSIIVVSENQRPLFGKVFATMLLPEYRMGKTAVELLERKMEAPDESLPPCALPLPYTAGETVAPPP